MAESDWTTSNAGRSNDSHAFNHAIDDVEGLLKSSGHDLVSPD